MLLLLFSHPPTVTPPVLVSVLSGLQGRKTQPWAEKGTPIETFACPQIDVRLLLAATCIVVGDRWGLPCRLRALGSEV
jgi:hypothetical protein